MLKLFELKQHNNNRGRIRVFIIMVITLMLVLFLMRIWAAIVLRHKTNAEALPLVSTVAAVRAPFVDDIILPGTVSAWHEAPIYARTNGYVKTWYVDIGSRVNKGDLLAKIETPELDAQLRQAEADLNVVIAKNKLAQSTAIRWLHLLKTDSVSKQSTDVKVDTAAAMAAAVEAQRAVRDKLRELVGFERVIAPFKGIISDRKTDIGALINKGSTPSERKPLFRLVQVDPLRIYVKIPQTYASRIKPKMTVSLEFAEHPGQRFKARLLETAHAIDPVTRTLLAQFTVRNKNGELLPGGYTEVHFAMPSLPEAVRLPVNTLIFRQHGLEVALLDKRNRVVLKPIVINRNFGTEVEVASGIQVGEHVIINPSDSIYAGQQTRLAPLETNKPAGG